MKNYIDDITNNDITELCLSNKSIGDEEAKILAQVLATNTSITKLDLTSCNIKSAGAQALAEMLKTNTSITHLVLRSNYIEDEGAKALAKMLETNTSITHLDLQFCNIKSEGAQALAHALKTNTGITKLVLHGDHIGDQGAQALAKMLEINYTITHLDLTLNDIKNDGAQALVEGLKHNTSITNLVFRQNDIGDERQQALKEIQALIRKNNLRFENKCEAVMEDKFENFSLKDIQTFIPILDTKINDSHGTEQEEYMEIKHKIMRHFSNYLFPRLGSDDEAYPLPPEIMMHITSFMMPSYIDLRTPVITNTPQPSSSFVENMESADKANHNCRS